MKTKIFKYENKNVVQVYITKSELTDNSISNQIQELKDVSCNNIVVFTTGNAETVPILKEMILHQKNIDF